MHRIDARSSLIKEKDSKKVGCTKKVGSPEKSIDFLCSVLLILKNLFSNEMTDLIAP
jgi:hypothetical protein